MKTFEVGEFYEMFSPCDQNCTWEYKVIARTSCTVTLYDGRQVKKCRISKLYTEYNKAETVFPLGQYSMCPILSADHTC